MLESLLKLQKRLYEKDCVPAHTLAQTYVLLGEKREALRYLQTSYEHHESGIVYL